MYSDIYVKEIEREIDPITQHPNTVHVSLIVSCPYSFHRLCTFGAHELL